MNLANRKNTFRSISVAKSCNNAFCVLKVFVAAFAFVCSSCLSGYGEVGDHVRFYFFLPPGDFLLVIFYMSCFWDEVITRRRITALTRASSQLGTVFFCFCLHRSEWVRGQCSSRYTHFLLRYSKAKHSRDKTWPFRWTFTSLALFWRNIYSYMHLWHVGGGGGCH